MKQLAGWATHESDDDGLAHQVDEVSTDPSGRTVYGSLCGQFSASLGWTPAGPAARRCPGCQNQAAGTPD